VIFRGFVAYKTRLEMSSLRAFRIKPRPKAVTSSPSTGSEAPSASSQELSQTQEISQDSSQNGNSNHEVESEDIIRPPAKRPRVLSDSDGDAESPVKEPPSNGYGFGGMPSPDVVQTRLELLQKSYPNKDRMDLQDALKACGWSVQTAMEKIRNDAKDLMVGTQKFGKLQAKKSRVRAHEVTGLDMSDSEEEDEYMDKNKVYDSDSEAEEEVINEKKLPEDKKRVLKFFNEATEPELVAIQGCSKKKVQDIMQLRPYDGWLDLVTKVQDCRNLSTDMLNNTTSLLKMRDAVSRLMDKCEKITEKMAKMVEELTSSDGKKTPLESITEQPKSIPDGFKMTGYQMIGLNWLVLMHKQSLNGILADEMGLGKTIQSIAFLAHLKELGDEGPHLIIVPSSTMDNWQKELSLWSPNLKVLNYYGAQDERRHMRLQIVQEEVEYDVILTTYNMVISSADDRVLFRRLDFHYVIFDEAHMLKNMNTARYENLMRVQASRKLLLTGTPMQNNLVELMSLLVFVMPDMFANKKEQLKKMFVMFPKTQGEGNRSKYEMDRILHAKRIMKPFFLRRLKSEVLKSLPKKSEELIKVPMTQYQHEAYFKMVAEYKKRAKDMAANKLAGKITRNTDSGIGMLMNLRKIANHPLLIRNHFDVGQVRQLARILKKDASHDKAVEKFIAEDLSVMSDFDIHKTCLAYRCVEHYSLGNHQICDSGKFNLMDDMLPQMQDNKDRVLIFTQFVMVLDIMEQYLRIRGYKYLRLDGSTPVPERQAMIDTFNTDETYFIFLLSTRAGGLGINLTAANTVILHDLDFNPYNDKQAEDRCHRVGQTRPVRVIRFISEETIEEGIYSIAQEKLKLEQDLVNSEEDPETDKSDSKRVKKDVSRLLRLALDVDMSEIQIGDVNKVYTDDGGKTFAEL